MSGSYRRPAGEPPAPPAASRQARPVDRMPLSVTSGRSPAPPVSRAARDMFAIPFSRPDPETRSGPSSNAAGVERVGTIDFTRPSCGHGHGATFMKLAHARTHILAASALVAAALGVPASAVEPQKPYSELTARPMWAE